jgi:hypothetical protein
MFSANCILPQSRCQNGYSRTCVCACTRFHACMVHVSLINNHTINIGLQILCLASYSFSTTPVLVIVGRENGVGDLKLT